MKLFYFTHIFSSSEIWYSKNAAISACRFLKVEGSYMLIFTVLGAIVLALIIRNEAVSTCRFLKVEGFYMQVPIVS